MQEAFGTFHIIYLVVTKTLIIVGAILAAKYCKTQKSKQILLFTVAATLLTVFIWNRISHAVVGKDARQLLPYSYCAMTSLLLSICTMVFYKNRNHPVFHCLFYIGLIGPIAAVIFPENILGVDSQIFAHRTISFFMHHSLLWLLSILLIVTKEFKPDWRKVHYFMLGLCVYIAFGLFQLQALNMEYSMEINKPFIADSILTWYFVGVVMALPLVLFIAVCYEYSPRIYEICRKRLLTDSNSKV